MSSTRKLWHRGWLATGTGTLPDPAPAAGPVAAHHHPEPDPAALLSAPRIGTLILTALGILVSFLLLLMKLLPVFPGHFTHTEWLALALWLLLGATLRRPAPATAIPSPSE